MKKTKHTETKRNESLIARFIRTVKGALGGVITFLRENRMNTWEKARAFFQTLTDKDIEAMGITPMTWNVYKSNILRSMGKPAQNAGNRKRGSRAGRGGGKPKAEKDAEKQTAVHDAAGLIVFSAPKDESADVILRNFVRFMLKQIGVSADNTAPVIQHWAEVVGGMAAPSGSAKKTTKTTKTTKSKTK